jgi:phosphate acetyltransferase
MPHTLMLVPTSPGVGLITIALGLERAIANQGASVCLFKPVATRQTEPATLMGVDVVHAEAMLSAGRQDELLEEIVGAYEKLSHNVDFVVVQGMISTSDYPYATRLNDAIAKALAAELILVAAPSHKTPAQLAHQIEIMAAAYGSSKNRHILGCIINKINAPTPNQVELLHFEQQPVDLASLRRQYMFHDSQFKLLAAIPWQGILGAPRVIDVARFLNAHILNEGDIANRRVIRTTLCARSLPNMVNALAPGTLIITAGDRSDIFLATCMAALSGIKIAAILLTGGYKPESAILNLCQQALQIGLPVLSIASDSFRTATQLQTMPAEIPDDDTERLEKVRDFIANAMDSSWIQSLAQAHGEPLQERLRLLSPSAFRYQLVEKARKAQKRIVLPEGTEPRTLAAASLCAERGIAHCILLGEPAEIQRVAKHNGINLSSKLELIDPKLTYESYVPKLVALRQHKGMTPMRAREQLQDTITLGTLLLHEGKVDGLVSGALHTTADTIRPALQIIKTAPEAKLVSSIFFMCLPEQVLVYGDCAVNPNPNAEELADIAIQSADSAKLFGIMPRVAMLSYSTGSSGSGQEVDKVRTATDIVRQKRPDIIIDGPLQYDAALIESVAKSKAPNSPVAGKATVFIFPDLNTGNTTYKAVQRSADVLSIGPMLQGLRKPVNDLSRGATIDDIVYTIALTAIQASN